MMHRNKSVQTKRFAMTPRAEIPRSSFKIQKTHKTTFDSGYLIPIYCDEVLPGDTVNLRMTAFTRMSTPLFPVMDNLYLDTFFFFIPNRLLWRNWVRLQGERMTPNESIDYTVPQCESPVGGYAIGSIFDYFGLPTVGQVEAASKVTHSALPLRAYNLVYNEWFRDENLCTPAQFDRTYDGPDLYTSYALEKRGKRHDYFTSCLPWPQKGDAVTLPLGSRAPIYAKRADEVSGLPNVIRNSLTDATVPLGNISAGATGELLDGTGTGSYLDPEGRLYADLSEATAATINALRTSFQIQRLLERDARGGTRYTEIVRSHFGVLSPDARLQRPEYLGGGSTPIVINPVAQTSGSPTQDPGYTDTPLGTLGAMGTGLANNHGFTQSFTEHGVLLGIASVRADLTYQQGLRKMWSRKTRYDFYMPAFAHLGEQSVLQKEIYCTGVQAEDDKVFGYQERWAEYRYQPSEITGLFRSTSAGTIDPWHLAQRFTTAPTLNATFIKEAPPLERALAVGSAAGGQQFICDMFFNINAARPLPMYSTPGLLDHF